MTKDKKSPCKFHSLQLHIDKILDIKEQKKVSPQVF
jgi:hypothetical protein